MLSPTLARVGSTALVLSAGIVDAFWRLECDGSVGVARIDPLMDFGGISDHVHVIKGGSGKSPSKQIILIPFAFYGNSSWASSVGMNSCSLRPRPTE